MNLIFSFLFFYLFCSVTSVLGGNEDVEVVHSGNGPKNVNLTFALSAKDLPGSDRHTGLDPYVKVLIQQGDAVGQELEKIGKTEYKEDTSDPDWAQVLWIQWIKGTKQILHFIVKDHDFLNADDQIGDAILDVDEYVRRGEDVTLNLTNGGTLRVRKTTPVTFTLGLRNVPKRDEFTQSDTYVKCYYRIGRDGEDTKFYETSVISNSASPDFLDKVELAHYIKGTDQYVHFRVKDQDTVTKDDVIGEAFLYMDPFVDGGVPKVLNLEGEGVEPGDNAVIRITMSK